MQSILCTNSTCARCAESPHQIKLVRSFPNNFRSSPMIKLRWIFGFDFTLNRLDDDVAGNDDVDRRKELWVWMACGKVLDPGGFDHPPPISPFPQCILPTLPVTMRWTSIYADHFVFLGENCSIGVLKYWRYGQIWIENIYSFPLSVLVETSVVQASFFSGY